LLALAVILGACSSATPATLSSTPPPLKNAGQASSVAQSIGDMIVQSSAIVDGTVIGFAEPVWNSPDGADWEDDYIADPQAYGTIPIQATPVRIQINSILKDPTDAAPEVASGGQIDVYFVGPDFVAGERRVWFLRWTQFYMSDSTARDVWYGDDSQASWLITADGFVEPVDDIQGYSLAEGQARGAVEGSLTVRGTGRIRLEALAGLIVAELRTTKVDLAGFKQWSPDPAYERATAHDDEDIPIDP
jgi:hypothetical protein